MWMLQDCSPVSLLPMLIEVKPVAGLAEGFVYAAEAQAAGQAEGRSEQLSCHDQNNTSSGV